MGLYRRLSSKFGSKRNGTQGSSQASVNGTSTLGAVEERGAPQTNATQANGTSAPATKGTQVNGASDPTAPGSSIGQSLDQTKNVNRRHSSFASKLQQGPPQRRESKDAPAATRKDVESTFDEFAQLIHASNRPMPTQTGDGSYLEKDEPSGWFQDLKSLSLKDVATAKEIMDDKRSGKPQNDREKHMEHIMQLVAELPTKSATRKELTSLFLDELWKSLEHPPQSYMGQDFSYRSADGSNNSYVFPKLGAANTPYARSVRPKTVQPGAYPDPGLIFDSILAREEFKPNPNKVSSIFFNWASLVIHDLFQTDHVDPAISKTSSYLDLSILYGDTQEDQNHMRTFKDGRIKPDCFAEERLLAFPPSCGVMLIMLNRFHNYVVEELAKINENGRFTPPDKNPMTMHFTGEKMENAWKKHDNDLFQTGRHVTCGLYINVTLYDYLRTIVNLNRTNSTWCLDPRIEVDKKIGTPAGTGNQVSAEFALSYRWHSCIGQMDEKWTEMIYHKLFGKAPSEVTFPELMQGLSKYDHDLPEDPQQRPFAGLQRDKNGNFDDGELAKIMVNGIEEVSGAFGARNIPKCLRAITILGIQQGRSWNLGTLNEFRKFFGLKTYDTFEEINPDKYVAEQLKHLYEHPDFVELYPGIAAEETKDPMIPGVGICPTHTISRAVLSDAVALVRGDRFYTVDYNPKQLTNWGYNEVQYDLSINQGCVFYKLLLRGLPNHFKSDSIYAHYPMTIPSENANIMKNLGRYNDYSWDRPEYIPTRINLTSYQSAKQMLESPNFKVMWNDGLGFVMGKTAEDFCLGGDTAFHKEQKQTMAKLLYRDEWHKSVKDFYQAKTMELIRDNSCKIAGINQVDITRDVGNLAHTHFAANVFALPLKSKENPKGIFTDHELYMAMAVIFTAIFFDFEPTKSFPLRQVARKLSTMLGKLIEINVKTVTATGFASKFIDGFRENHNALHDYGIHMLRKLSETGMSTPEMVYSQILPTSTAMVPNQSQVFTQIIDYYLSDPGLPHLAEIQRLARGSDTPETDDKLLHYAMEGIRLNGTFGSYRRAEVEQTFPDEPTPVHVKPGDKVFCSFIGAAHDASVFPDPESVKIDRPIESYVHYGIGAHTCLGKEASMVALTAMLRTVGRLDGLRRAKGGQGQLKKVPREGGFYVYMREDHGGYFPFPLTFKVHYDSIV